MKHELIQIKDEVINKIVVMTAIFFSLPFLFSLMRWFDIGWHIVYLFHTILYVSTISLALFRRKINYTQKTYLITILYLIIALFGLYNFALSGGFYYAIISMAILAILTERKIAILINLIIIVLFSFIAFGYSTSVLHPSVDITLLIQSPSHWFLTIFSIFSITLIFIFGFGDFYKKLTTTLIEKDKTTADLIFQKDLLERAEIKYKTLFDSANDAIFIIKGNQFIDCNEKTCEYFQLSKETLLSRNLIELSPIHQYDGQKSDRKAYDISKQVLEGSAMKFEWEFLKANGELFDASISLNKIILKDTVYIQAIMRDITEKKINDKELKNYRDQLEKLVAEKTKNIIDVNKELNTKNAELTEKNKLINDQVIQLK
tara:strand:+ start:131 stop:1252 length:1122 start_codon:yes stop_codon:yes gene_type:complete